MPYVVAGVSLSADVDGLVPEVERLSVVTSSPEPVDVCVGNASTVAEDGVTAVAGPVDVAVHT